MSLDHTRPEGSFQYRIERISKMDGKVFSPEYHIRGLPWYALSNLTQYLYCIVLYSEFLSLSFAVCIIKFSCFIYSVFVIYRYFI
jgi:hypothetical protein